VPNLPTKDISAIFADSVIKPALTRAVDKAVEKDISAIFAGSVIKPALTKALDKAVSKPHSSGNPTIYLLPLYAMFVAGVLKWVENEFPKFMGK